jgi:transposase InsO family protein
MNLKRIPKSNYYSRLLAVQRVLDEAWTAREAAQAGGVSDSLVGRWLKRYHEFGLAGLADRTSRPHSSPKALAPELVEQICQLRVQGHCLSYIAQELHPVRCTVWRWLKKFELSRLPRPAREAVVRYEASAPGELVHIDIKKLRSFDQAGRKFIDQGGVRQRGAARLYLHVAVDSYSRYAVVRLLDRENGTACIAFLQEVLAQFAELGVKVSRFLTDNGSAYRGKAMAKAVTRLGITHSFTRVRRPQTNGKAERFILTAMREWGYLHWPDSAQRDADLPRWTAYYNQRRNHSALGKPPVSRLPGRTMS